jgi:hypothetical protein
MALSMTVVLCLIRRAHFAGKGFAEERGLLRHSSVGAAAMWSGGYCACSTSFLFAFGCWL